MRNMTSLDRRWLVGAGSVLVAAVIGLSVSLGIATNQPPKLPGRTIHLTGNHRSHAACGHHGPRGVHCNLDVVDDLAPGTVPAGLSPTDLEAAYRIPVPAFTPTVAVVDAFDLPDAESELAYYRNYFALPPCTYANGCLLRVNQNGLTSNYPCTPCDTTGAASIWQGEIGLDMDMVSAACPVCHIVLVEANSQSDEDLATANDTAARLASYVSNSWGGSEFPAETTFDVHYHHPGVSVFASTGDTGDTPVEAQYPAASPWVTAVGGTTLTRDSSARGWNEVGWNKAGSGCSVYESMPSWQQSNAAAVRACGNHRAYADVSADGDPNSCVAVYLGGWNCYAGTSLGTPLLATMAAIANSAPNSVGPSAPWLDATPTDLYDVISGPSNDDWYYPGQCLNANPVCQPQVGWDGPTGLGTPLGIGAFSATALPPSPTPTASPSPTPAPTFTLRLDHVSITLHPGQHGDIHVSLVGTVTVTLSISGLPAGVTAIWDHTTVSAGHNARVTISVAKTVPFGTYLLLITGTGATTSSVGLTLVVH